MGPFAPPPVTISTLLLALRGLLLDANLGPSVPAPDDSPPRLADVRLRGRGIVTGQEAGTINWIPGTTGWPWLVVTNHGKKASFPETSHEWEDWAVTFNLGLTPYADGMTDLHGWAEDWDTQLTQWFAGHRRFGLVTVVSGDVWQEYHGCDIAPFVDTGVPTFGLVGYVKVHNVVPVPWGI